MTKRELLEAVKDADDDAEISIIGADSDMDISDVTISDDGSEITIEVE